MKQPSAFPYAIEAKDALHDAVILMRLLETMTANVTTQEAPIDYEGLCYLAMLTREKIEQAMNA